MVTGKGSPPAADDRGIAKHACNLDSGKRRRHEKDLQVRPDRLLNVQGERQPKIGMNGAFVELIEDDQPRVLEGGVILQHARQDPLGDHLDARFLARPAFAADAIADRVARFLAEQTGHVLGRPQHRKPPRLEHEDLSADKPGLLRQRDRNPGRLACSRLRREHDAGTVTQNGAEVGKDVLDRERRGLQSPPSGQSRSLSEIEAGGGISSFPPACSPSRR